MKGLMKVVGVVLISSFLVSCVVATDNRPRHHHVRKMPPGQAKKYYGGSARDYAPGHNKHMKKGHGRGRGHGHGRH